MLTVVVEVSRPFRCIFRAGIDLQIVAVACHRNIGEVLVYRARRQHVACIHGRALRFVDRDSVAVIEALIAARIERNASFRSLEC